MHRSALCLIALCVCLPVWADPTPELGEIVVTATRVDTGVRESPSAITVIGPDQIAASPAKDVAGLIRETAGVVVKENGPTGEIQTVSLRGSTSEQVLVLVDGMRVNSSIVGTVDLSTIPVSSIERIEIVRGADSALYGSSAIGGVINIITKSPQKNEMTVSLVNGSFLPHDAVDVSSTGTRTAAGANPLDLVDSQKIDLSLAGKLGDVELTGGGTFDRAANEYTWDDTTGINAWRRRTNADSLAGNGFIGITAPMFGGNLSARGTFALSNAGEPGSLQLASDAARQEDALATGELSWKTDRFFTDALTLDLKAGYRDDDLVFDYHIPGVSASEAHTQEASLDLTQKLTVSDLLSAVYGGNVTYDYVDSTDFTSTRDRLNASGFLSLPFTPLDALTITPSARYDFFSDYAGNLSWSLSGVYLFSPRSSLRASVGSAYRAPTLDEMYYYDPFGSYISNPNLKPETSYNGEIGWSLALDIVSVDASVFTRLVSDNISNLEIAPYVYEAENLSQTLFPGAELHLKLMLAGAFSLEASYTFVDSFLLNDGTTAYTLADDRRVPNAPVHTLTAEARYTGKVHSGGITLRLVSDQFTDTANAASAVLPGYAVVDADYRFDVSGNLAFSLTAKNIFNTLYETQPGYPMPPFSLEAGLRLHLS